MNVGIVTTWFERGAAYVSKQYLKTLEKEHNVFVYARGGEKGNLDQTQWDSDIVTWSSSAGKGSFFIEWKEFSKWVNGNKIELIIFNEQQDWEIVLQCKKKLDIPIGSYIDYYTESTIPFFTVFDFLLCNTKRHLSIFNWHSNCIFIPWGTDIDLFKPTVNVDEKKNVITFFHSCGLSPFRKGTDLLCEAFSKIKEDTRLIIHAQEKVENIRQLMEKYSNDTRIEFIVKEVTAPGLYSLGDVYVYPTRLDGIGLTIVEALSSGLPVITTDSQPMNEFVDSKIGKVVKVGKTYTRGDAYYWPITEVEVEDLVEKMRLYITNSHKLEIESEKARQITLDKYNWLKNSEFLNQRVTLIKRISFVNDELFSKIQRYVYKQQNLPNSFYAVNIFAFRYSIRKIVSKIRTFLHQIGIH